ncbi:MAG: hypothetical protein AABN95_09605 [Acidobacteriota bacterium]
MYLSSLGDIVAIREMSLTDEQGIASKAQVLIGAPKCFPDSTDYYCPFQILGLGDEEIRYAGGVDGIQALQLVMSMIGAILRFRSENTAGTLRWEAGNSEGDFGFPVDQ